MIDFPVVISEEKLTKLARDHARELGLIGLARVIKVRWNHRMRSTAGRAYYQKALIELNPHLVEISEEELHRTFLHEMAHLVAYARNSRRRIAPHGEEWRKACRDLGIPNEKVTHDLPLPSRQMERKWHYTCPNCSTVIKRARKMKGRGGACYDCCKNYNNGKYTKRFSLQEKKIT